MSSDQHAELVVSSDHKKSSSTPGCGLPCTPQSAPTFSKLLEHILMHLNHSLGIITGFTVGKGVSRMKSSFRNLCFTFEVAAACFPKSLLSFAFSHVFSNFTKPYFVGMHLLSTKGTQGECFSCIRFKDIRFTSTSSRNVVPVASPLTCTETKPCLFCVTLVQFGFSQSGLA